MPIYEYRCGACGAEKEVLQKLSDPPLTLCPACGKPEMVKQVSAAGFQLKGTGWYVTDFKNGSRPPKGDSKDKSAKPEAGKPDTGKADASGTASGKPESAKAESGKSEASGAAAGSGSSSTTDR